jgi:hypothetical protein
MAKRPWFCISLSRMSYSLRALMLFVTAVGLWLGYEVNWIQQRRAFTDKNPTAEFFFQASDGSGGTIRQRAPGLLWLFGEQGVLAIDIRIPEAEIHIDEQGIPVARPSHPVIAQAKRLFPESEITAWTMDYGGQLPICNRFSDWH